MINQPFQSLLEKLVKPWETWTSQNEGISENKPTTKMQRYAFSRPKQKDTNLFKQRNNSWTSTETALIWTDRADSRYSKSHETQRQTCSQNSDNCFLRAPFSTATHEQPIKSFHETSAHFHAVRSVTTIYLQHCFSPQTLLRILADAPEEADSTEQIASASPLVTESLLAELWQVLYSAGTSMKRLCDSSVVKQLWPHRAHPTASAAKIPAVKATASPQPASPHWLRGASHCIQAEGFSGAQPARALTAPHDWEPVSELLWGKRLKPRAVSTPLPRETPETHLCNSPLWRQKQPRGTATGWTSHTTPPVVVRKFSVCKYLRHTWTVVHCSWFTLRSSCLGFSPKDEFPF